MLAALGGWRGACGRARHEAGRVKASWTLADRDDISVALAECCIVEVADRSFGE